MPAPAPMIAASARLSAFVWTHVRQALQQTVAIGALSPTFTAVWANRPVQTVFTGISLGVVGSQGSPRSRDGTVRPTHRTDELPTEPLERGVPGGNVGVRELATATATRR
jgi:hypothetical protein